MTVVRFLLGFSNSLHVLHISGSDRTDLEKCRDKSLVCRMINDNVRSANYVDNFMNRVRVIAKHFDTSSTIVRN